MSLVLGLTYDLRSEFPASPGDPPDAAVECDPPERIDAIVRALEAAGVTVRRIGGVRALLKGLSRQRVDLVLNVAEGWRGHNRESEVPMVLELSLPGVPLAPLSRTPRRIP